MTRIPFAAILALCACMGLFGCPEDDPDDPQPPIPEDPTEQPTHWVDPIIGTGGLLNIGAAFPGATTPFGMVRLGPDTTKESGALGVLHAAGYWYEDDHIEGFSHLHLVGTGVTDYGNVSYMPTLGMDASKTEETGYRQVFDHADEEAKAGHYSVLLPDPDIQVELTATAHTGMMRLTYPASEEAVLLLDLAHTLGTGEVTESWIHLDPDNSELWGSLHNNGEFTSRVGGVDVYFVSKFSRAPSSWGTWDGDTLEPGGADHEGADIGGWFQWNTADGEEILVQTGISMIDLDHARLNLDAEFSAVWDFDAVRNGADSLWNSELETIEITGGSDEHRTEFYSSLYRTMMMPTSWTEVGGDYLGFDREVWYADGFTYYTDFSLWDTVRTTHPLYSLIFPDRQADMMTSIRKMQEQGGAIPKWALATGDTGSMIGTPADILISEAYLKGIPVTDVEDLYEELYAHATGPVEQSGRSCMEEYVEAGYMAFDSDCRAATSSTLEYAHHDFGVAQLADALGHAADAAELYAQAGNWANLFDPETLFFRGKTTEGEWKEDFDPGHFSDDYTEANAWHYRFHVPHDAEGLAEAFGGTEVMVEAMDETFELASEWDDMDLPNLYYWQGNEPSIHAVWMFAELGRPDLAQKWSRWILDATYSTEAGGLAGNDDCGTLSAWYIFAALGFYPLMATDVYLVGSPMYEQAVLHLPGGDLTVTAEGASDEDIYVQSVSLNGVPLDVPWFRHADVAGGGSLDFVMGPQPSSWGLE